MSQTMIARVERGLYRSRKAPVTKRLLTGNSKTTLSWDVPLWTCRPTRWCRQRCYACFGHQRFPFALRRCAWAYRYAQEFPEMAVGRVLKEMARAGVTELRLYGKGDWEQSQMPFLSALATALRVRGWGAYGFTKKPEGYEALTALGFRMWFSLDRTTDISREIFAYYTVGLDNCAYSSGPEDKVEDLERFGVVFPDHKLKRRVPESRRDCPAIRRHAKCGVDCKRCMTK